MPYILLSSAKDDQNATRSFNEFTNKGDMAKLIIDYFEDWLQLKEKLNGGANENMSDSFEYASDDLFNFMDNFFGELCCLEKQNDQTDLWIPQSTDWIKEQIYLYLRSQSEKKGLVDVRQGTTATTSHSQSGNVMEVDAEYAY